MNRKAFTLIELLVVIAIVGILSGIIIVSMNGAINAAKDAKRKTDIDTIRRAVVYYKAQNTTGLYPVEATQCTIGGGSTPCSTLASALSTALPNLPVDPVSGYYSYVSTDGTDFTTGSTLSTTESYTYTASTGFLTYTPWSSCGDSITFTYNGSSVTYGTVTSPTGKCWLDRNLGASQVATAYNDSLSYGDYFQWGRGTDGHQIRTSSTTITLSSTDTPGHGNFIINNNGDWRSTENNNLWQGVSGINNPCPSGWRLPTNSEWATEITSNGITNTATAYSCVLKLPATGYRFSSGGMGVVGSNLSYWVSGPTSGGNIGLKECTSTMCVSTSDCRAMGLPVRCVKN